MSVRAEEVAERVFGDIEWESGVGEGGEVRESVRERKRERERRTQREKERKGKGHWN